MKNIYYLLTLLDEERCGEDADRNLHHRLWYSHSQLHFEISHCHSLAWAGFHVRFLRHWNIYYGNFSNLWRNLSKILIDISLHFRPFHDFVLCLILSLKIKYFLWFCDAKLNKITRQKLFLMFYKHVHNTKWWIYFTLVSSIHKFTF